MQVEENHVPHGCLDDFMCFKSCEEIYEVGNMEPHDEEIFENEWSNRNLWIERPSCF